MSAATSRRGFLRGLTTLPLVGGSVALIGKPTAVALPLGDVMLDRYTGFIAAEYVACMAERAYRQAVAGARKVEVAGGWVSPRFPAMMREEERATVARMVPTSLMLFSPGGTLDSRAAVVLSAVGIPLGA